MAYTNFQHCTANEYKNIIYNQETNNKIKILFNNVELEDADEYCESFEVVSRVIPNGSKIFMLENLVSQEATLVLHNIDTSIIQDQVSISIGTLVSENTYEYVPIGIYNLQEIPTTDNGKTTIKLRDNSVKLDFNYNAKPLIDEHGGTATKLQILQDICSQANITCNVASFIGSSDLIGIYDNTITGRQYVSYLAGSAGAIPIITRSGALDFKYLNNLSIIQIPIEIVEQYSNAENFKISRVVYEDAIRKYESGNETYDTLFLDSANPYISSQEQVASIYNIVNNFEINSFTTGRILGNPAIDSYDLIQITDYDGTIFKTFANNTLRYNGKMINTFASEISFERKKENVSLKSGATFKKWAKTEIDNANAQITIQAGQIEEIEQELSSPTSIKENKYFDLEDALDSPLIDFSMEGQTEQDSTTGKNLLRNDLTSQTINGLTITINDDKTIKINGTASANTWLTINGSLNFESGKTYILSGCPQNGSLATYYMYVNGQSMQDVGSGVSKTFSENITTDILIKISKNAVLSNLIFKPMLRLSNTTGEYEPYTNGASPNPDYPQPIHNVSGDNTIEICGKNLFNKNNTNIVYNARLYANGNYGTDADANGYYVSDYIRVKSNENIAFSETMNYPKAVCLYDKNKTHIIRYQGSGLTTINTGNAYYIRFGGKTSSIDNMQVEYGTTSSEYEAYTGQSQLISLGVENQIISLNKTGNSIYFNGATTQENYQFKAGKYTISYENTNTVSVYIRTATTSGTSLGTRKTITFSSNEDFNIWFYRSGITIEEFSNVKMTTGDHIQYISDNPIELNKISTYQDYIYKENNIWYLHKEIGKVVLDGTEIWSNAVNQVGTSNFYRFSCSDFQDTTKYMANTLYISDNFTYATNTLQEKNVIGNTATADLNRLYITIDTTLVGGTTTSDFKTWLSTHNTIVNYVLDTPTDTEITDTTLLEQLNRLMTLPLYKNMTHITLTPNDLQPTMKIEYYRDTSLNNTFVPKTEMNKYYTKTETIAQIQIGNSSIQQNVAEIQTTLDSTGNAINTISNQVQTLQSSTSLQISAINTQLENGVEKLTNSLVKIDANGINTSKQGETFNTQITNKTFEVRDGNKELAFIGYNNEEKRTIARMDDLESKRAIIGVHRTEVITRQGRKRTAGFYVGGDN